LPVARQVNYIIVGVRRINPKHIIGVPASLDKFDIEVEEQRTYEMAHHYEKYEMFQNLICKFDL